MQKLYCSILKSQRKIKQDFFIAHSTSRGKKKPENKLNITLLSSS